MGKASPECSFAAQAEEYVAALNASGGVGSFVANGRAQVEIVRSGDFPFPMTVNDGPETETYVNSLHVAYSHYAAEEVGKVDGALLRGALRLGAGAIGLSLRMAGSDSVVHVNNWMFSTNPWPRWDGEGLENLVADLMDRFPDHFIVLRSLTRRLQPGLMTKLARLGFDFIPSRAVWLLHDSAEMLKERRNLQRDRELLEDGRFERCSYDAISPSDFPRIKELYDQLYRVKYSKFNPAFTERFLEHCHATRLMEFEGLRDEGGVLVGICGCLRAGGTLYQPIAGYDIGRPQSEGLYRRVEALAVDAALRAGFPLHLSAGVGAFKRSRGAEPEIEYSAVLSRHLAPHRRMVLSGLARVLESVVVPMVRKREL